MKRNILYGAVLAMALLGVSACQHFTAKQNIAATCDAAATALQTITAGKRAGRVSESQLHDAVNVYEAAVIPVCSPVPAASLSAVDYDALLAAAAKLALTEKVAKP